MDKKSVERMESVEKTTAADLVKNWGNGNNEIFTFSPTLDEESQFKITNQFDSTSNMPKFIRACCERII